MHSYATITKISQIEDNIYLSGVVPMELDPSIIKEKGITHILCCVSDEYVSDVHQRILTTHPGVTILYLPYNDDTNQNLWKKNDRLVKIMTNISKGNPQSLLEHYNEKPLIDVGYHFIDLAVQNKNHKVLVHCMAGISRSVSLVVYYKMKKRNVKYDIAYNDVKSLRPIALPNPSFKIQLMTYDRDRERFTEKQAEQIIQSKK